MGKERHCAKRSIEKDEEECRNNAERMTLVLILGWYFVWHLFLSKFKFLRELVGDTGSQEGDHEPSGSETEEDPSSSPHRVRSARQRRAPTDEGH
uniref:small integral membrane protein 13 n=1 Tax=Ictidomys tridecemlineatus TaxID=43179 RepID=UPI00038BCE26|nr:small integral membrane protein 13 [Ictidomys tridecemlineatus]